MIEHLKVGLSSWIIQDGNYGDFTRGERVAFALEFYAPAAFEILEEDAAAAPVLEWISDSTYRTQGHIVHVADDWWVIDAGILIFRDEKPPSNASAGGWIRGEIYVGIDPFFYFERLAHQPDAPSLIYDWQIERIEMLTAPFIEVQPRVMERDMAKLGWKEIASTRAWDDDGGNADYILHCRRLGHQARRTRN